MIPMNPECQQGKHENCDGIADLDFHGNPIECGCVCHAGQAEPSTTRHAVTCGLLVKHTACTCGLL